MTSVAVAEPNRDLISERFAYRVIVALRVLFSTVVVVSLDHLIDLGTSTTLLIAAIVLGTISASAAARSRLTHAGFLIGAAAMYGVFRAVRYGASLIPGSTPAAIMSPANIMSHVELFVLVGLAAAVSTWAFWRVREMLTAEIVGLLAAAIYLLSGHRNYHLDSPRAVNSLAWTLGYDQLTMLIAVGAALVAALLTFVLISSHPARPDYVVENARSTVHRGRRRPAIVLGIAALIAALIAFGARLTYSHYNTILVTRIANGVGQESQEGLSPLGFHSALGSTNQPAALVRLEGDYHENPFTPMLYLRESALSQFNGKEMVIANRGYDRDVSWISPKESFQGREDPELHSRIPVIQSFYLLTEHQHAFALDYPLTITQLKNPNPSKFRGTYRAYSVAPGFSKSAIQDASVGDPRWDAVTRAHYLEAHPDIRYAELAKKIAGDAPGPVERAFTLGQYLSQQSTYTLTPNHEVSADADQTAPYLFGDLRGYCVHFAHAMVYLLRSLGIPSRIGTGYLTDLSQSRDGHILLRMSDRHAWAEVYIAELGWVPFDVQPEKVESHADTQVDMKLLEELMGLLEPGEEILPKDIAADQPGMEEPSIVTLEWRGPTAGIIAALAILIIATKFYLRFGWVLATTPRTRLRRSYRAAVAVLFDAGIKRQQGETRSEFRRRVEQLLNTPTLNLTPALSRDIYGGRLHPEPPIDEIDRMRGDDLRGIGAGLRLRRMLSILNPASAIAFLSRRPW